MSVVALQVTDEEIVIGADSIRVSGWTQEKDEQAKLIESRTGVIVGTVGYSEEFALMRLYLEASRPRAATEYAMTEFITDFRAWAREKADQPTLGENHYLIVIDGHAFELKGYFIHEVLPGQYAAIGAGMEYAMTALYLGAGVERAVEAACELSVYCERPINLMRVPRTEAKAA